jgi:hypothetical protein
MEEDMEVLVVLVNLDAMLQEPSVDLLPGTPFILRLVFRHRRKPVIPYVRVVEDIIPDVAIEIVLEIRRKIEELDDLESLDLSSSTFLLLGRHATLSSFARKSYQYLVRFVEAPLSLVQHEVR